MKKNNNNNKNKLESKFFIFIILLLLLILGIAFSRYVKTINGNVTAQVSQYNFNVTVGSNTNLNIDLADTRIANDSTMVESGYVAPGTKGAFNINVIATNTQSTLKYNIDLDLTNIPENLIFYSDSQMKKEVMVQNNKIKIEDCIGINDEKTQTISLYWQWPFETGENDYEIGLNDVKDSAWIGEDIGIAVNAVSTQVPEKATYLADSVQIGDYVNYDATSGDGDGLSITPPESQTGSSTLTTFYSSDISGWRVFDVDSVTKTVTLIAEDPTEKTLALSGKDGWKYGVDALNSVGAIFGHGNGAYSGRSIQETDISRHSSYNPNNYNNTEHTSDGINVNSGGTRDNLGYYYYTGNKNRIETETYTRGTFITENNSEVTASAGSPVTMRQTHYSYRGSIYIQNPYYNLIFKQSTNTSNNKLYYWVSTRKLDLTPTFCRFCSHCVKEGWLKANTLWWSYSEGGELSYNIVSMITLQSNIKVTGQNSNQVWQLDLE